MENKQQPVVNICGSCILRDTFYYQGVYGKEKDGGYRINRYVNFFSPLALEQPPIPIYDRAAYEAFDLKPFGLTNFFRRCRRLARMVSRRMRRSALRAPGFCGPGLHYGRDVRRGG